MNNNTFQIEEQRLTVIEKIHGREFSIFQNQIGLVRYDITQSILKALSGQTEGVDAHMRPLINAGISKIYTIEGNFTLAKTYLLLAEELAFDQFIQSGRKKSDIYSYVVYETAIFDLKFNEPENALKKLSNAIKITNNPLLLQLINYQIERLKIDDKSLYNPSYHSELVETFQDNDVHIMYALGLHDLGNYYQNHGDLINAMHCFENGSVFAIEKKYAYLISLFRLEIAYNNFVLGNVDQSIALYQNFIETVPSYYLKSKALEELTFIHYRQKNPRKAEEFCLKAINNSSDHKVSSQLPGEYVFLGDLYSKELNEPEKAHHFYKLGFETSISQVQDGYVLKEDRLRAINRYIEFISFSSAAIYQKKDQGDSFYKQFEGMTWAEIRDQFHYNLIIFHRLKTHKFEIFLKSMGLIKATYYSNHLKLKSKGFEFPDLRQRVKEIPSENYNQSIQDYIDHLDNKTWFSANKHFDQNVMSHFYKINRYKKTALAKSLQISYQAVRNRTAHLSRTKD